MLVRKMDKLIETEFGTASINKEGYYQISSKKEGNRGKLLHRVVFEDFYNITLNEEFPEGVVIHHEDGDKLNNQIWNLVPMSYEEHSLLHNKGKIHSVFNKQHMSKSRNTTGIFRVSKRKRKDCKQGFQWIYRYYEKDKRREISSVDLNRLKEKVEKKGLDWIVFDDEIKKVDAL